MQGLDGGDERPQRGLATLMAKHGASPAQIAAHLGHADGGVLAMRTYVHPAQLTDVSFVDQAFVDDATVDRNVDRESSDEEAS